MLDGTDIYMYKKNLFPKENPGRWSTKLVTKWPAECPQRYFRKCRLNFRSCDLMEVLKCASMIHYILKEKIHLK